MFQARHMRLARPGVAEVAMSGDLPGTGRAGTVLFISTRSGTTRTEYNAVVLPVPAAAKLDDEVLGEGLQVARHDGTAVIYAKSAGDTKRSAEEVDGFLGRAIAAVSEACRLTGRRRRPLRSQITSASEIPWRLARW